jgi:hypothetical protein
MTLQTFAEQIGLSLPELRQAGERSGYAGRERDLWILFQKDPQAFLRKLDSLPDAVRYPGAFWMMSCFAVFRHGWFEEKGIPDQIYYDTFRDIAIWHQVLKRTEGINGLKEYRWTAKPLTGELYRLGRLEFEPDTRGGILWIHIPEGGALSPEAVDNSLRQAAGFFPAVFGQTFESWQCESWMLAGVNREFMKPDSNILKFAGRFTPVSPDFESSQAVERVFDWPKGPVSSYPENTGLQKRFKKWLLAGGRPMEGRGKLKEIPSAPQM